MEQRQSKEGRRMYQFSRNNIPCQNRTNNAYGLTAGLSQRLLKLSPSPRHLQNMWLPGNLQSHLGGNQSHWTGFRYRQDSPRWRVAAPPKALGGATAGPAAPGPGRQRYCRWTLDERTEENKDMFRLNTVFTGIRIPIIKVTKSIYW